MWRCRFTSESKFRVALLSWYSGLALTVIQDCWQQAAFHFACCKITVVSVLHFMQGSSPPPPQKTKPSTYQSRCVTQKLQGLNNNICDGGDTSLCVFAHDHRVVLLLKLSIRTLRSKGHLISGITPLQLEVVTLCPHCHGPKGTKAKLTNRLTVRTLKERGKAGV